MTSHGATLIYKVGTTIVGTTGSVQSADFEGKATTEKYQGSDGEFVATSTFGFCADLTHTSFPTSGNTMSPGTIGTMVTVGDSDGDKPFITGSNWIVEGVSQKPTNKGAMQQVVKLWRANGITS